MVQKAQPRRRSRRSSRSRDEFLRLMSHEMRTPLNGVIGMLGLLSRTKLDGAQRAYAASARESAEHLLGLVNDLLDFARLDAGKLELEANPVDLERLCQGVAELLSPKAHEKGLEIVWTVDADVPQVLADDGRLRQILFNLGGNAVKFTPAGGVRIAVQRAGGTEARPRLRFVVDDTGPGVPEDARARVFEQFGHVDPSDANRFGGTGLGLAVVDRLVQAMGGQVGIDDRPGGGARFWVEVAFDAVPDQSPRGRPLEGIQVCVVSPDPFVREAAIAQVVASGGEGRAAESPETAACPVVLVDHACAPEGGLAPTPSGGRGVVLLRPQDRDLIPRYRARGYAGYLIKPLRRVSLAERVLATLGAGETPAAAREDERVTPIRNAGLRILLVEDNPVNALLARTLLRREGCAVETAGSGQEALDALARARYDLVLMDMRMPGMDGATAARRIRECGDDTPIVALTANAFAEDRRACLEAGMNDHLPKPIDADALRAALARWTNREARVKLAS